MNPCHYCRCKYETDSLRDAVAALVRCNNCTVDIQMDGEWTGKGKAAIEVLVTRFGREAVAKEWESTRPTFNIEIRK